MLGSNDYCQHDIEPCVFVNWAERREPVSTADGLLQGVGGATHDLVGRLSDALLEPVNAFRKGDGMIGVVDGVVHGLQGLIIAPMAGGFLLYNKVSTGIAKSLNSRGTDVQSRRHSLPDPQRHFSRPGGLMRQEDSVYGTLFPIDQHNEVTSSSEKYEPIVEKCDEKNLLNFDSEVESEEENDFGENLASQDMSAADKSEESSHTIEGDVQSDVLALDVAMHRDLRHNETAAFVSESQKDSIEEQMHKLFYSFTGNEDSKFDFDSEVCSEVPSPSLSRSDIVGGSSNLWGSQGEDVSAESRNSDNVDNDGSDVRIIFAPLDDSLSEVDLEDMHESDHGENSEDLDGGIISRVAEEIQMDGSDNDEGGGSQSLTLKEESAKIGIKAKPPLLFNSVILSEQLHHMQESRPEGHCSEKSTSDIIGDSSASSKSSRETDILSSYLLAKKLQQTLEDVVGSSSRFVTTTVEFKNTQQFFEIWTGSSLSKIFR